MTKYEVIHLENHECIYLIVWKHQHQTLIKSERFTNIVLQQSWEGEKNDTVKFGDTLKP